MTYIRTTDVIMTQGWSRVEDTSICTIKYIVGMYLTEVTRLGRSAISSGSKLQVKGVRFVHLQMYTHSLFITQLVVIMEPVLRSYFSPDSSLESSCSNLTPLLLVFLWVACLCPVRAVLTAAAGCFFPVVLAAWHGIHKNNCYFSLQYCIQGYNS